LLTSIDVELEAVSSGLLPFNSNSLYIHALFFKLVSEDNETLGESIHNRDGFKPYTLSSLRGGKKNNWNIEIIANNKYRFRATFLNDDIFIAFFNSALLYYNQSKPVKLDELDFKITKLVLKQNESFEELTANNVINDNNFELIFTSPTSFRVKGRNYLFPDSSLVFKSYFDKWNAFCPEKLRIAESEINQIITACFPVKHHLYTELLDMGKYKVVGFKGKCQYEVEKTLDEILFGKLNWLLRFSRYSGTGYKTTMGMGQTTLAKKDKGKVL